MSSHRFQAKQNPQGNVVNLFPNLFFFPSECFVNCHFLKKKFYLDILSFKNNTLSHREVLPRFETWHKAVVKKEGGDASAHITCLTNNRGSLTSWLPILHLWFVTNSQWGKRKENNLKLTGILYCCCKTKFLAYNRKK